jgi:FxsC-like protein
MSAVLVGGLEGVCVHGGHVSGGAEEGYSSQLGADDGPFFFLSYAHEPRDDSAAQDPDLWIGELYEKLCEHVKALAELPTGRKTGFMDRELQQGQEWPWRLSHALATCRVFVPLYSRRYFRSEHCGREWFAFNRRRLNQQAKGSSQVETIVPALWIPVRDGLLPEAARSVQFNSSDFGPAYAEHGFYGIMKVSRWRADYEQAVYLLARRIVDAGESMPLEPEVPKQYESLPSAFGGSQGSVLGDKLLRITVVSMSRDELTADRDPAYYGKDIHEWNPYRQNSVRSLADYAAELARSLSYTPDVGDLYRHETDLLNTAQPAGPQVLLIDPAAVLDPECQEILRRFDALDRPWVQVVVIWNGLDEQMRANAGQLRAALSAALPRKLKEGRATSAPAVRGVESLQDFGMVLPTVIAVASRHYLRFAATRPHSTGEQ